MFPIRTQSNYQPARGTDVGSGGGSPLTLAGGCRFFLEVTSVLGKIKSCCWLPLGFMGSWFRCDADATWTPRPLLKSLGWGYQRRRWCHRRAVHSSVSLDRPVICEAEGRRTSLSPRTHWHRRPDLRASPSLSNDIMSRCYICCWYIGMPLKGLSWLQVEEDKQTWLCRKYYSVIGGSRALFRLPCSCFLFTLNYCSDWGKQHFFLFWDETLVLVKSHNSCAFIFLKVSILPVFRSFFNPWLKWSSLVILIEKKKEKKKKNWIFPEKSTFSRVFTTLHKTLCLLLEQEFCRTQKSGCLRVQSQNFGWGFCH